MIVLDWYSVTIQALQNLWQGFLSFIPVALGAIVIFVIGWFVSMGVGRVITEILKRIKFNKLFDKGNWKEALQKADIKVDAAGFIGAIVKWILVVVFLLASVEIIGLNQLADFLKGVLGYLPNVLVAVLIFVVTVIVVDIVEKITRVAVEKMKVGYGSTVSAVVKWSIWIFAVLAILYQLGIVRAFTETLFTGLIATLALIFGLSFGLGGKEVASEILQNAKRKLKD